MAEVADSGIERQSQVQKILESETFQNKESLRRLLFYLWERTQSGTAEAVKEYTIGLDVLGKPETYDPQIDPSARVLAGKLRQRLKDYYASEGARDPVVIELPRRHFELLFRSAAEQPAGVFGIPAASPRPARRRRRMAAVVLLCFAAGAASALLAVAATGFRPGAPQSPPAAVRAFWAPLLEGGRPALVCFGTPLFIRFYGARLRISDDFDAALETGAVRALAGFFPQAAPQPSYIFTGVGEAAGGFMLSRLFARWGKDVSWRRSSALTWDDIRTHNLIFLGSARYNPHLRALPVRQAFVADGGGVTNVRPLPGEPPKFERVYSQDEEREILEDYAIVSRLPGINGHGDIVVLGSSSTEGTIAAVEYATEAARLDDLRVRAGNLARLPPYFEALLRVRFRGMVPVESSLVTFREHPMPGK